jgi:hypothetical protein
MEQNPADLQKKRWMLDFENPAFLPDWNFLKTLDSESSVFKKSAGWKETTMSKRWNFQIQRFISKRWI